MVKIILFYCNFTILNQDYPVVCIDEAPKPLIKETRVSIKMKPEKEKKVDFEYERKSWCESRNNMKAKINWQFTTKDARIKSLYPKLGT